MTVYVDNANIPAKVGRIRARWSHLTADTKDELHAFAARLGLKRAWFQDWPNHPAKWPTWHYDVTASVRAEAVALGAKPIDIREMGALVSARRKAGLPSSSNREG